MGHQSLHSKLQVDGPPDWNLITEPVIWEVLSDGSLPAGSPTNPVGRPDGGPPGSHNFTVLCIVFHGKSSVLVCVFVRQCKYGHTYLELYFISEFY